MGWEGNGEPVMIRLLRHCIRGNPWKTDRHCLPLLSYSFTLDFVITGASREVLENKVKPLVKAFLKERGLELSEEKTKLTHISEGFDFPGFNVRKYKAKLLIFH